MNITKEETGKLSATVKIEIVKEDYAEQVEKVLRDQQKKAVMHGFRPGKVPFGLIKKIYGKSVMLDEINHLLSDKLNQYIQDEELRIIGNPLPNREKTSEIDLDNQTSFDFYFDIGLMPEFDMTLDDKFQVEYYDIKATDKMVDEYVHDLQHRFGEHKHEEGTHEEGHEDEHEHDHEHEHEHHHEHEHEHIPAELNEEFYNKIFPDEEIKDEKAFREKIREGIEKSLVNESDRYFMNTAIEKLVEDTHIELPEDFLRKWMKEGGEEELTDEQVANQYDNFTKSLRWQLIESKIIKDHGVKVEEPEMRDFVKEYFTGRMIFSPEDTQAQERLDEIATSVLSNKEEAQKIHEQLFDKKMLDFMKGTFKLKHKKLDYEAFVKLVTDKKEN